MLEITMTACRRAEILDKTLGSFYSNVQWPFLPAKAHIIINVDPVGPDENSMPVLKTANNFFVIKSARMPSVPNFAKAFKWVWREAEAPYILHLEDDWELLEPFAIGEAIKIMEAEPDLALLRLPWRPAGKAAMKNWRFQFPWNGRYFECPEEHKREVGFCGHPSLIRGVFVKRCAALLDVTRNPEKQFHYGSLELMREVDRWRYGVWGYPEAPAFVRDLGRDWMLKNGWQKAGNKAFFMNWERNNG